MQTEDGDIRTGLEAIQTVPSPNLQVATPLRHQHRRRRGNQTSRSPTLARSTRSTASVSAGWAHADSPHAGHGYCRGHQQCRHPAPWRVHRYALAGAALSWRDSLGGLSATSASCRPWAASQWLHRLRDVDRRRHRHRRRGGCGARGPRPVHASRGRRHRWRQGWWRAEVYGGVSGIV